VTPYGVAGHRHVTEIDQELPRSAPRRAHRSCRTCCRSTRASSSPATARCARTVDVEALFTRAYASEPFVELADRPRGARRARHELCRIHARCDERTGKVFVFAAIDNLWKGAVVAGGAEPQPDVRLDETVGLL
jgi:N-acetyl-gamma-glutamyl-phosphate reductase